MKLLVISNNPFRPSFRQRIEIYLDSLATDGIESEVHKLPRRYIKRWRLFAKAARFDTVLLHKKCLNLLDARCLRSYEKKIIYDFDDAVMYKPGRAESEHTSHMRLFKRTVLLADCVIAGNGYLAEHAHAFNSNVHVLPTGLVVDDYRTGTAKPGDGKVRLVWIGSRATLKYLEQLRPTLEEAGRRFDNIALRIICDSFLKFENIAVEQRRWSIQTQSADMAECDIGLAPLPDDRFTRGKCAYKVLQYMAAGLPTIASPVGVNQQYIADSGAGLLAADTQQWLEGITSLVNEPSMRVQMAQSGQKFVRQFDRSVLAPRLTSIIKS